MIDINSLNVSDEIKATLQDMRDADVDDKTIQLCLNLYESMAKEGKRKPLHPDGEEVSRIEMKKILGSLVDSRMLIIEDDSHKQSEMLKRSWALIDAPKNYDFQDDDFRRQDVMRELMPEGYATKFKTDSGEDAYQWSSIWRCPECDELVHLRLVGTTISFHSHVACENHSDFKVTIDFPTGEVLALDWYDGLSAWRKQYPEFEDLPSVNQQIGIHAVTDLYAEHNICHFFVGNTCPGVYLTEDGKIVMRPDEGVRTKDNVNEFDEDEPTTTSETFLNPVKLNNICTDLWWATLVDRKTWEGMMNSIPRRKNAKALDLDAEWAELKADKHVISVPAGRYEFHCNSGFMDGDHVRRITGVKVS
jgi:hypothetical protein